MWRSVRFCFAVALGVAVVPGDAVAAPPECRAVRDVSSSDPARQIRRLLGGLIPSIYVKWRGRETKRRTRGGRRAIGARPTEENDDRRQSRTHRWEVGLRWSPLEMLASAGESDADTPDRPSDRIDSEVCRRLARLRHRISARDEPEAEILIEKAILERRLESAGNHD